MILNDQSADNINDLVGLFLVDDRPGDFGIRSSFIVLSGSVTFPLKQFQPPDDGCNDYPKGKSHVLDDRGCNAKGALLN